MHQTRTLKVIDSSHVDKETYSGLGRQETETVQELHLPDYDNVGGSCQLCMQTYTERKDKYKKTNWKCISCDQSFCQKKDRNCFEEYHLSNAEKLGMSKKQKFRLGELAKLDFTPVIKISNWVKSHFIIVKIQNVPTHNIFRWPTNGT
jgi:peroxiredoxin